MLSWLTLVEAVALSGPTAVSPLHITKWKYSLSDLHEDIAENKRAFSSTDASTSDYEVHNVELSYKWLVYFMSAFNLFEAAKSSFLPESGLSASESGSSDSLSPECAKRCQKCKWATESSSGGSASLKWNSRL